jgi:mannose-6-phosphate isomerase-like protein (cupin superfamily)
MNTITHLTADMCKEFSPRMFAVNHAAGEKVSPEIQKLLDPVDTTTFHAWELKKENFPKLHFHDFDEYWLWSKGRTMLTIRLPDGRSESFEIGPGWIVYCVRGVEHGHLPLEDWCCFECISIARDKAQKGHLFREFK